jgi:NitT/TauT family transport system substrate-binding protein
MNRRTFGALAASTAALLPFPSILRAQDKKPVIIAQPLNGMGYLPLYLAVESGFFAAEGLAPEIVTIESSGGGHTNAVLSGQAFAFIGGPEHNAFAKVKGNELRSVVNVVGRGNLYFVAKKGLAPGKDIAAFLKGRKVGTTFYGGTPNSVLRYVAVKAGLPLADFTIVESTSSGLLALMKTGQIDVAVLAEPQVTQGMRAGLWDAPFYNVPAELGPYAYSVMNIRQQAIEKEPETVAAFVRAMIKGLHAVHEDPKATIAFAHKRFPTMQPDDLEAAVTRGFADKVWSTDGLISEQSWTTAKAVVTTAGLLKEDVPYAGVIDMRFVAAKP